jgi:hypothetical protein
VPTVIESVSDKRLGVRYLKPVKERRRARAPRGDTFAVDCSHAPDPLANPLLKSGTPLDERSDIREAQENGEDDRDGESKL